MDKRRAGRRKLRNVSFSVDKWVIGVGRFEICNLAWIRGVIGVGRCDMCQLAWIGGVIGVGRFEMRG